MPSQRQTCADCPEPTTDDALRARRGRLSSFRRRRDWRGRCLLPGVPDGLDLVESFLFLVDAHGKELDHRLADTQATLELVNQPTTAFDGEQDVNAFVKAAHQVRE